MIRSTHNTFTTNHVLHMMYSGIKMLIDITTLFIAIFQYIYIYILLFLNFCFVIMPGVGVYPENFD